MLCTNLSPVRVRPNARGPSRYVCMKKVDILPQAELSDISTKQPTGGEIVNEHHVQLKKE